MKTLLAIWVVDDDEDDQYLFAEAFGRIMPRVAIKQLTDGEELLSCLQATAVLPRLVLMDLNMPRLTGFETLKQLRSVAAYQQLPVIMLTTSEEEADKRKSFALGANGFLTKPASQSGILAMFQQLLREWEVI